MFIPHSLLLLTQRDIVASNCDSYILSLMYTEIIRFHPEFSVAFVNLKTMWLRAKPVLSSTPVVLLCLWRWVCQHHKPSSNNIIPSIEVRISTIDSLIDSLIQWWKERAQMGLFRIISWQNISSVLICVARGKVFFVFFFALSYLVLDEYN